MTDNSKIIILACDVDPDRPEFGGPTYHSTAPLTWHGVQETFQFISSIRRKFNLAVEWFFRCDDQIEFLMGAIDWCLAHFEKEIKRLHAMEDGIGWHFHTWRWQEPYNLWFQEKNDLDWITGNMKRSVAAAKKHIPDLISMKSGWTFHTPQTLITASQLGIQADFSAMPAIWTDGLIRSGQQRWPLNSFDWKNTPTIPFWPSRTDHRVGTAITKPFDPLVAIPIMEIPVTTFKLPAHFAVLRKMVDSYSRGKSTDFRRGSKNMAAFNIAKPLHLAAKKIKRIIQSDENPIIHYYFHPDDLLAETGLSSKRNFVKNLGVLMAACTEMGQAPRFLAGCKLI